MTTFSFSQKQRGILPPENRIDDSNTCYDQFLDRLRDSRRHLPPLLEIVLSYFVCATVLLFHASLYYWDMAFQYNDNTNLWKNGQISKDQTSINQPKARQERLRGRRLNELPLMVPDRSNAAYLHQHSKPERDSITRLYECIMELIHPLLPSQSDPTSTIITKTSQDCENLLILLRSNASIRRLVCQFYRRASLLHSQQDETLTDVPSRPSPYFTFYQTIDTIWDRLLELPSLEQDNCKATNSTTKSEGGSSSNNNNQQAPSITYEYMISLIIPSHKESFARLNRTLQRALDACESPQQVQVILVQTADETDDHPALENNYQLLQATFSKAFGDWKYIRYAGRGGRGPTLNAGARAATGRLLTFLHADVLLPPRWDDSIRQVLLVKQMTPVCAFMIDMDLRPDQGLEPNLPYPYGIQAVRYMINIRSRFFNLPYGDQVISIPAAYFEYVGGYPDQPIMEDFDFIHYFRQRGQILRQRGVAILPDAVQCSPRRWQNVGVLYFTLSSALLVYRYTRRKHAWTPQQVYEYYYLRASRRKEQLEKKSC